MKAWKASSTSSPGDIWAMPAMLRDNSGHDPGRGEQADFEIAKTVAQFMPREKMRSPPRAPLAGCGKSR
jgi:hypothetical protein